MAKVDKKTVIKKSVSPKQTQPKKVAEVENAPAQEEESLVLHTSGSESESESEDIEGLSSADEGKSQEGSESSTHKIKKLTPKQQKNQKDKKANDEYSSIIYVSRLPHGFQERELSKYFSQFGDLKEVRLARNKKSGNSRHYGFVEFANKDDAKVAQESMNNYLLMGHLLKVNVLPKGAKIEKLFRYKKRAFIEVPVKKSAEQLKENAKIKHNERLSKLADAGIDFKW